MHSDLEQARRDEVMHDFRGGRVDVLVATDILARGIDIDDIALVVNYDVPREAEDYVHRIGRTARAGAGGSAVTLVGERDQERFAGIEDFLGKPVRREEIPSEFGSLPEFEPSGRGRGPKNRGNKPSGNRDKRRSDKPHAVKGENNTAQTQTQPVPEQTPAEKTKRRRHRGGRRGKGKPQPPADSAKD